MPNKAINNENKCLIPVVLEKAWSKLAATHCVDNALLRHEIASSWKRCLASNIDPSKAITATNIKNFIEQDKKAVRLLAASHTHIQQLYDTIKGHGYVIILTDAQGIILTVLGDKKVMNFAESVYLIPGANCSENAIGTNSLGTCLIQKNPSRFFPMSIIASITMIGVAPVPLFSIARDSSSAHWTSPILTTRFTPSSNSIW